MADESPAPEGAAPEQTQSVDDFIGALIDAPESDAPSDGASSTTDARASEAGSSAGDVEAQKSPGPEKDTGNEGDTEAEGEPGQDRTIAPPQSMSAKDREAFYKLPPESQKWLADREHQMTADYTRKTQETAKERETFRALDQVLAPHRETLAMRGMTEAQAVGQLIALANFADRDFPGFVREQARLRGVQLEALLQQPGQQADPVNDAVTRRLAGVENVTQQLLQQTHTQATQSIAKAIESFAAETGTDGSPAYPYYAELEADMVPIVAALRQSKPGLQHREYLVQAYKSALAMNDEVSARADVDRRAKEEAKRVAEAKKKANEAKKAAGPQIRPGGALPPAAQNTRDIDQFIGALVDERMAS